MRAGIYERKSTAQDNVPEDAKSVVHQDKRCRAFIAQQGWTVLDAHVYVDDASRTGPSGSWRVLRTPC